MCANIGHGVGFCAAGNPQEFTQVLQNTVRSLGGRRPVALIE